MNSETETKLESNNVHNIDQNKKLIKCFCNDEQQCPSELVNPTDPDTKSSNIKQNLVNNNYKNSSSSQQNNNNLENDTDLAQFLNKKNFKFRTCLTNTMCLTKKLKKTNGEFWLKYSCDQSASNSIRDTIIEFRDCKINTNKKFDKLHVQETSPEYCCDEKPLCNIYLEPKVYVKDIMPLAPNGLPSSLQHDQGQGSLTSSSGILNPINLVLSCFSIGVFIIALILFVFYLYKKFKIESAKMIRSRMRKATPTCDTGNTLPTGISSSGKVAVVESPLSPYVSSSSTQSSSTTSTTNTCINSKENSYNQSDFNYNHLNNQLQYYQHKHQLYANDYKLSSGEVLEPFLPPPSSLSPPITQTQPLQSMQLQEQQHQHQQQLQPHHHLPPPTIQFHPNHHHHHHPTHHLTSDAIKINSPLSSTQTSGCACTNSIETPQSPSELSSGSGSGFPQCVHRTIARQIKLIYPCIGKGRFGEVYKGEWRGELVAVKTFNSADEKSWENEYNIYSTTGFRHENILGFIGADNIDRGLYTELWLITEFHENGSLYDYLINNQNLITPELALKMSISIANGLVHLHMPIESYKGKPALAHCDLKSKNILVKSDLTCCIGDLGLALSGDKDGKVTQTGNIRTGTKRYMAPEILSKQIDFRDLSAFQKAEMYSLALILWELLHSCKFESDETKVTYTSEYKMPYYEYIQGDPDEALMIKIVCEDKIRPRLNSLWSENFIMNELMKLTEELWVENPNERLPALRLKKSLTSIKKTHEDRKINARNT